MRFKIVLERTSRSRFLPVNYQYPISSWIYKRIQEADPGFSNFLHSTGYNLEKKQYKLFTFGRLQTKPFALHHDRLEMKGDYASIEFSFVADQAAENFIKGLFMNQVNHERFAEILYDNLLRKYAAMQMHLAGGVVPDERPFDFGFKLLSPYRSKLITIKSYSEEASKVRGYLFDFELTAPAELQEMGYNAGFGEKNSMGMGMGEVIEG